MKTIKFLAVAAIAVFALSSCANNNKASRMVMPEVSKELKEYAPTNDKEIQAMAPTNATMDSVSYLFGVNFGMMFQGQGIFSDFSEINMKDFEKGLEAAFEYGQPKSQNPYEKDEEWAKQFKISPYDMNQIINAYIQARNATIANFNKKLGENFLAANAKKSGVKQTESGLQYILHAEGEGDKVQPEDKVLVNYKGTLLDGTEFDANEGIEFQANRVIAGWTEGLGLLGKGGKATLFIPSELAYGERAPRGSKIEPNSTLIFEVEVLDIIKPAVTE